MLSNNTGIDKQCLVTGRKALSAKSIEKVTN